MSKEKNTFKNYRRSDTETRQLVDEFVTKILRGLQKAKAPMLQLIHSTTIDEGHMWSIKPIGGEESVSGYKEHEAELSIPHKVFIETDFDTFWTLLNDVAEEMAKAVETTIFTTLNEVIAKTGNIVNGKGKPPSIEMMIEMLDKMEVSFNDDGSPGLTVVCHPEMRKKFEEIFSEPENRRKWQEAIDKKRKEYFDKKKHRRLS